MNPIVEQLINDPKLVENLVDFTSSMSLALVVIKLREQERSQAELRISVAEMKTTIETLTERLEKSGRWAKKLELRLNQMEAKNGTHGRTET
jgi:septal ring factor EnvC (AmiA/AmiB activator)